MLSGISGGKGVRVTKEGVTGKTKVTLSRPSNDGLVINAVPMNPPFSINRGKVFRDSIEAHNLTAAAKMGDLFREPKSGNEALIVSMTNEQWKKLPQALRRSLIKEAATKAERYQSFALPADQVMRFDNAYQLGRSVLPLQVDGLLATMARSKNMRYFRVEAPKGKGVVDSILKMIRQAQGTDKNR